MTNLGTGDQLSPRMLEPLHQVSEVSNRRSSEKTTVLGQGSCAEAEFVLLALDFRRGNW